MKVLTINCVDDIYSTGKIISSIEKSVGEKQIVFLHCYEVGKKAVDNKHYRISNDLYYHLVYLISVVLGKRYGTGQISTYLLCKKIMKFKPDIVHIHCPNARSVDLYYLLHFLKKIQVNTIITNHAEFFYTGNCAHAFDCDGYKTGCTNCTNLSNAETQSKYQAKKSWNKMYAAIHDNDKITMVVVSPWQKERALRSPIFEGKDIRIIGNGVDVAVFTKGSYINSPYKNIIHVTSYFTDQIDDIKGGRYIIELARKMSSIRFTIVGSIGQIAEEIPDNVEIIGEVRNQKELASLYSKADLLVMTSRRETFGMTCVEAMCCGTPVVGFENGGTESIALKEYSSFVTYADIDDLIDEIKIWIDRKPLLEDELSRTASEVYSEKNMGEKYINLYYEILDKQG